MGLFPNCVLWILTVLGVPDGVLSEREAGNNYSESHNANWTLCAMDTLVDGNSPTLSVCVDSENGNPLI